MKLFDLTGQVAVVTGATKGIGRAIADALAEAGADVVVSSRTEADCRAVADGIADRHGVRATGIAANVSDDAALDALIAGTLDAHGRLDILVCNAAVNPYYGPFLDTPDDAFDKTIRVNVRSTMRLCRLAIPEMKRQGGGAVVIVSSIAAFKGSENLGIYAVSKAADVQIVRNLALAHGPDNIRVNAIAPALVKTDFARALWQDEARAQKVADSYALKRLGEPEDIAGAAVFLAAPAGRWITGQTLIVDGGWSVTE